MKTPASHPLTLLGLAVLLGLPAASTMAADDAALQRCRAISEAGARLACYDALPLPLPVPLRAAAAPGAAPVAPVSPAAVAPAAVAPAATPAVNPAAAQRFGRETREVRDEPQTISSHIAGTFEGWGPQSRIKLANGQVWQVEDGTEGAYYLQNPKVTVRRGLLGSFRLEIEGAKRTPRVRRVD